MNVRASVAVLWLLTCLLACTQKSRSHNSFILEGTNVEIGKQILKDSGLPIITADDLDAAAIKAVATLSQ